MTNISITEQISVITFGNIPAEKETEFLHRLFAEAAKENVNIDMIMPIFDNLEWKAK